MEDINDVVVNENDNLYKFLAPWNCIVPEHMMFPIEDAQSNERKDVSDSFEFIDIGYEHSIDKDIEFLLDSKKKVFGKMVKTKVSKEQLTLGVQ